MAYLGYRGMSRQISAHTLQEKAKEALADNPEFEPVKVTSKEICTSWWGRAWCKNLERYSYYEHGENQIKRGEKFVINDAVVDLKIDGGSVTAHVVGDSFRPFEVKIKINPLSIERQNEIAGLAAGKIKNIDALAAGNFPEELKDSISDLLFPKADEIDVECDCSSHEYMCQHVAAALYGIGVRLDSEPLLFFEMRGIDVDDLIWKIVGGRVEGMLENIDKDSPRIMKGADLVAKFGVDSPQAQTELADNNKSEAPVPAEGVIKEAGQDSEEKKLRYIADFTPDEIMSIYYRSQEVGIGVAAVEAKTTLSVLKAIRKIASLKIQNGEAEPYRPSGVQSSARIKRGRDFTEEEKKNILRRSDEIGVNAAALEAGVTVWVVSEWRRARKKLIKREEKLSSPQLELGLEESRRSEAEVSVEHQIQAVETVQRVSQLKPRNSLLVEELERLKMENAVLRERLSVLAIRADKIKAAITRLI